MRLREVLALIHGLLGIAASFTGSAGLISAPTVGDKNGYGMLVVLGLLMLAAGAGLYFRRRWLVVLGAVPVAALALLFSTLLIIGGWAWGAQNVNSVHLMISGSLLLTLVELAAVFTRFRPDGDATESP